MSFWDGSNVADYFSNDGDGENFGQTVTVPTNGDNGLSSFSFTLLDTSAAAIPFQAEVSAWSNSTGFLGSPLFTVSSQTQTPGGVHYDTYTFQPNVTLTPGGLHVLALLASASGTPSHEPFALIQGSAGDTYAWGDYVYGASPGTSWTVDTGKDTVFTAVFTSAPGPSAPEPGSFALAFAGLAGICAAVRKGRRATMK